MLTNFQSQKFNLLTKYPVLDRIIFARLAALRCQDEALNALANHQIVIGSECPIGDIGFLKSNFLNLMVIRWALFDSAAWHTAPSFKQFVNFGIDDRSPVVSNAGLI